MAIIVKDRAPIHLPPAPTRTITTRSPTIATTAKAARPMETPWKGTIGEITSSKGISSTEVEESKLLDSIGTAQMEQELQKRVLNITESLEATMIQETGVQSSLTDEMSKIIYMNFELRKGITQKE